jgi:hypothetical protein
MEQYGCGGRRSRLADVVYRADGCFIRVTGLEFE